jgi:hypothetical protein
VNKKVEFRDDTGLVGAVYVTDELVADTAIQSLVDAWTRMRRTPAEFVKYYDGWSNGYLTSRVAG